MNSVRTNSFFREQFRRRGLAVLVGLALACTLALTACKTPEGDTGEEQRAAIRKANQENFEQGLRGLRQRKEPSRELSCLRGRSAASMPRFFSAEPGTAMGSSPIKLRANRPLCG